VGDEVRAAFVAQQPQAAEAFVPGASGVPSTSGAPGADGKWLADLYQLARLRLNALGITRVYGGELCTYSDPARFYSYRRDGATGRMGTFIWLS
jgi:copper oxidase (laccase) domain-containing protein